MMRGFSMIGMFRPKDEANVGAALRAAHCYGASSVVIEGARNSALKAGTNTMNTHKHLPVFMVDDDLLSVRPFGTEVVVVDLIPGATPLHKFRHPERAMYVFGPEDGTLGSRHTNLAQHVVYVPTRGCMNLAATVNVVLYDRASKRDEWHGSSGVEREIENLGVGGSNPPRAAIPPAQEQQ